MPASPTLAIRDIRALVESGEATPKLREKLGAALAAHDAERGFVRVENNAGLGDNQVVNAVLGMVNAHLRRFPATECALAVSLRDLFANGNTSYQR